MPKSNRKKLIEKLDKVFSVYIRQRDGRCVICGKTEGLTNGHLFSRINYSTRWDELNCHCQCLTKESKLRLSNGRYKNINKIKIGDILWGFDKNSLEKITCEVKNTEGFIPKVLYEIKLSNGKKFFATSDHKVIANGKWIEIKDMLHNPSAYDIMEL